MTSYENTEPPMKRTVALQVGERIKQLRLHSRGGKLTQETLAERADISVSFLSMIERGERSAHIETLEGLAEALGVSLEELFREKTRGAASVAPTLRPLIEFAERLRLNRRAVARLLLLRAACGPGTPPVTGKVTPSATAAVNDG